LTRGSAFSLSKIRVSAGAMEMEMAMIVAPLLPALARPRWCVAVALPLLLWRWCLRGSATAARSSKVVTTGLDCVLA